jgi:hypothetical protein
MSSRRRKKMTLTFRKIVLAIVLMTIVAFSAGVAAGRVLATQPLSTAAPVVTGGTSTTDYSVPPRTCTSSLGPEDYETCTIYFGEE